MTVACPGCTQVDQVQHVPAAYDAGHSTYQGTGPLIGMPAGDGQVIYSRSVHRGVAVTATARALDPFPVTRGGGCFLSVALVLLLPAIGLVFAVRSLFDGPAASAADRVGQWFVAIMFPAGAFALVALFAWLFVRRVRHNARMRRGIPAARAVWQAAWFCHRCGGVFFPHGTPFEVPCGHLLSTAAFRGIIARSGRYYG
ncbi:hypothetical protein [Amycolatopsis sp. NPDC059021]|uniref:hypothetical protein n=1 Tax=Amycolatopsis sp. NPDC059021 TaxID=3346704 RepID=UPI00366BEFAF